MYNTVSVIAVVSINETVLKYVFRENTKKQYDLFVDCIEIFLKSKIYSRRLSMKKINPFLEENAIAIDGINVISTILLFKINNIYEKKPFAIGSCPKGQFCKNTVYLERGMPYSCFI